MPERNSPAGACLSPAELAERTLSAERKWWAEQERRNPLPKNPPKTEPFDPRIDDWRAAERRAKSRRYGLLLEADL